MSMQEIDAYLAKLPAEQREALETIRAAVHELVPEANEGFYYGVPAFKYKGKGLAGYAARKQGGSYYPMSGTVIEQLKEELEGYVTSSGAIQFTPDNPLSPELLSKLVKLRVAEILNKHVEA